MYISSKKATRMTTELKDLSPLVKLSGMGADLSGICLIADDFPADAEQVNGKSLADNKTILEMEGVIFTLKDLDVKMKAYIEKRARLDAQEIGLPRLLDGYEVALSTLTQIISNQTQVPMAMQSGLRARLEAYFNEHGGDFSEGADRLIDIGMDSARQLRDVAEGLKHEDESHREARIAANYEQEKEDWSKPQAHRHTDQVRVSVLDKEVGKAVISYVTMSPGPDAVDGELVRYRQDHKAQFLLSILTKCDIDTEEQLGQDPMQSNRVGFVRTALKNIIDIVLADFKSEFSDIRDPHTGESDPQLVSGYTALKGIIKEKAMSVYRETGRSDFEKIAVESIVREWQRNESGGRKLARRDWVIALEDTVKRVLRNYSNDDIQQLSVLESMAFQLIDDVRHQRVSETLCTKVTDMAQNVIDTLHEKEQDPAQAVEKSLIDYLKQAWSDGVNVPGYGTEVHTKNATMMCLQVVKDMLNSEVRALREAVHPAVGHMSQLGPQQIDAPEAPVVHQYAAVGNPYQLFAHGGHAAAAEAPDAVESHQVGLN